MAKVKVQVGNDIMLLFSFFLLIINKIGINV